jgi:hypothetical protein
MSDPSKGAGMISVLVTYKVKKDRVAENDELIRAVYRELHEIDHRDVHYSTFKKEDGQTFVHIAFFPTPEDQAVLSNSKAFKAFQAGLGERCEIPPDPQPLQWIGSYNFSYPEE